MMRAVRIVATFWVCMMAVPGWADTRVRAGEHGTFTRLVFYFPSQVGGWSTIRAEDGYLIDIAPAPSDLDIAEVFAFIPRTRIKDLALRNGMVWVNSDCDCHISVFRARPDVIAVDIRDGPDPSQSTTPTEAQATGRSVVSPFLLAARHRAIGNEWQIPPRIRFSPPQEQAPQVINSTDLANAVARAASGGILRPNDLETGLGGPGIETRSALDSAKIAHDARAKAELCSNLDILKDLETLSRTDAWQLIENTTPTESTVQRAMAYVSLGFGAEAAIEFGDAQWSPERTILLTQVARFIDSPDGPAPRSIRTARTCGGVPALLTVMATPRSEEIPEGHARDAVNTLSRLPHALRAHLAPHLERRLTLAGFAELAQSARFTSSRAAGGTGPTGRGSAAKSSQSGNGFSELRARLPQTPFFDAHSSDPIYSAIAAAHFEAEDRILIEAWIKEAPSPADADAASAFYVAALNTAERPLDALAHLDARFGRRGIVSPALEPAIGDTLETAVAVLGPGELLVLGARIAERPWFERLPASMRLRFTTSVDAVRLGVAGAPGSPATLTDLRNPEAMVGIDLSRTSDPSTSQGAGAHSEATPRRIAAEAAILSATESLSRSVQLRANAAESTAEW